VKATVRASRLTPRLSSGCAPNRAARVVAKVWFVAFGGTLVIACPKLMANRVRCDQVCLGNQEVEIGQSGEEPRYQLARVDGAVEVPSGFSFANNVW
jgi:hypothetical protein